MSKQEIIFNVTKRETTIQIVRDIGLIKYIKDGKVIDKAPYSLKNLVRFTNTAKNTINFLSR